jgi:hypothetical protein
VGRDQKVSILLSYREPGAQVPEVDIKFDADFALTCFRECLQPAKATKHGRLILEGRQIIVPLKLPKNQARSSAR